MLEIWYTSIFIPFLPVIHISLNHPIFPIFCRLIFESSLLFVVLPVGGVWINIKSPLYMWKQNIPERIGAWSGPVDIRRCKNAAVCVRLVIYFSNLCRRIEEKGYIIIKSCPFCCFRSCPDLYGACGNIGTPLS
jgi:hypothetical protein